MSLLIGDNTVVSIHYSLSDADGNEMENSSGSDPLQYLHGADNLIPGLENALTGKSTGDELSVAIPPEEAYGEVMPQLVQVVNRTAFQGVDAIQPGMVFQAKDPEGNERRIEVKAVDGDDVTIDANHPLAGVELHFQVQVVDVREASQEEMAHGHVH